MQRQLLLWPLLLVGCGEPITAPSVATESDVGTGWALRLEPNTALEEAHQVLVLHLEASGDEAQSPPGSLALVEGTPSAVSLGKYEEGETTEALAERMIPTEVFEEANHVQLRAKGLLALGQTYTLISESGVLGVVTVAPGSEPAYLSRVWPPADSVYGVEQALFCGAVVPTYTGKIELFPPGVYGRVEPGLDSAGALAGQCVRLGLEDSDYEGLMPPARVNEVSFEPTPFANQEELGQIESLACDGGQVQLGPGCFALDGAQGIVTGPSSMTFWAISSGAGWHFQTLSAGQRFVVPNLSALSEPTLSVTVFDLAGRSTTDTVDFELPEPAPRVVINEVLANPLGSEPADEWVELTNAGDADAELFGYFLADGGGQLELPAMILEPGAFVLLTREDFVGGQAGDVEPASDVTIVRMAQLAKNGLTNSGEALSLLDASGSVVSAFPAVTADRAGTSIARRDPSTLDDDATGFVSHASPGASPGEANQVE